ncbi:MAG: glycosyltransferase family 2 protein [Deltaproteobacteria bacterium]|nr:glycosyltransferase family 2 protein [Deltaproteobacteria bacterium]
MKTSVIITTYNRPDMLLKVLEGLEYQTRSADEVIVADDGSGAQTKEIVHRFVQSFMYPLYHVWQEDRGFRAARVRNKAINKSDGQYIILLDGDCIPGKHFIRDHLSLAKKGFFFQGKRILINRRLSQAFTYEDGNSFSKMVKYIFSRNISNGHHVIRWPWFPAYSSTRLGGIRSCNMGFFREDIFAVNGFNQNFIGWGREDSELAVRLYKYGIKRREHPFMAVCYHLWHKEHERKRLTINDVLLRKAIESNEYYCADGLSQK